ncbi:hypothetical protein C5167_035911 [Papaver somniferum]|nr:hypothetical protein C5167_035911 [Papaver somniferum]
MDQLIMSWKENFGGHIKDFYFRGKAKSVRQAYGSCWDCGQYGRD